MVTVQRASDAERGISSLLAQSDDMRTTWTVPHTFGPPLAHSDTDFQGVALPDGRMVVASSLERSSHPWRIPTVRPIGSERFEWQS